MNNAVDTLGSRYSSALALQQEAEEIYELTTNLSEGDPMALKDALCVYPRGGGNR